MPVRPDHVVILGAGPAGLMAAHDLALAGIRVTVLERAADLGGLCGTTLMEGPGGTYRFDYGGHRFITRDAALLALVEELVGDDLLTATRKSVIRLGGRTYRYPLEPLDLLSNAPMRLLAGAAWDVLRQKRPDRDKPDFEGWTKDHFGPTLYDAFFKDYTAKLWGIAPHLLSADWAEQRISLLDLKDVARRLMPGAANNPRTYARSYRYPRLGFGVIFDRLAQRVRSLGGQVRLGVAVTGLEWQQDRISAVITDEGALACSHVISTLALPTMVTMTGGRCDLGFRGLRFLNMAWNAPDISDCTWHYLSDGDILATRLQEPRRRSSQMAPPGKTSVMLEIPCDPGSDLWDMDDAALYGRALADLDRLGLDTRRAAGVYVSQRAAQAYPLMRLGYESERARAMTHLNRFGNLIQCGRQGTFRYIFTDTAMETGRMAAESLLAGRDDRAKIYDHRNERTVIEVESVA